MWNGVQDRVWEGRGGGSCCETSNLVIIEGWEIWNKSSGQPRILTLLHPLNQPRPQIALARKTEPPCSPDLFDFLFFSFVFNSPIDALSVSLRARANLGGSWFTRTYSALSISVRHSTAQRRLAHNVENMAHAIEMCGASPEGRAKSKSNSKRACYRMDARRFNCASSDAVASGFLRKARVAGLGSQVHSRYFAFRVRLSGTGTRTAREWN
jgi:hypothetical protein